MKINIKYSGKILNLPAEVAEFTSEATKEDLCVIINLFAYSEYLPSFDSVLEAFSERIGVGIDSVLASLSFWSKKGVISVEGMMDYSPIITSANRVPSYSGAEIKKFMERNEAICSLFNACQEILGKSFTPTDYNNVIFLKDYYKFTDDYILLLLAHCAEIEKKSWAYIRKTAAALYNEGIDTYGELEKHFEQRKNQLSLEYKIRSIFGMGMRELSKKESEKIAMWLKADISEELIRKAYDITVDKTGKASFVYASKIVENWISVGYKTLEDVEKAEANHKSAMEKSSFDVDDFFKAALERSEKIYGKEVKK